MSLLAIALIVAAGFCFYKAYSKDNKFYVVLAVVALFALVIDLFGK